MKKVIAYSGGIDSTSRATQLLREHPEVEWTLCLVDMGQTSNIAQRKAMEEMVRRHPEFKTHIITIDLGFNPVMVQPNGVVLQNPGVLPFLFSLIGSYARNIGADEVYTGYDRWNDLMENAYATITSGPLGAETVPINHFGSVVRGIQGTLDATGCTWADVDFTVSCSGDPDDPLNKDKIPCGHCPKDKEREAFSA